MMPPFALVAFATVPLATDTTQLPSSTLKGVPIRPRLGLALGEYKAKRLLAELRSRRSSPAESCAACVVQNKATCCHLTRKQCAQLRAAKRAAAVGGESAGKTRYMFDCGHAYRGLVRIRHDIRGRKERARGMCIQSWRDIISDGRMTRIDHKESVLSPTSPPPMGARHARAPA
ncbi:hypothetical protein F5Y17DRAFT_227531 [Xylariaceae sp. FL0594]|nr:hypothetical protein F5Y17DRAFT_227531 [Xylariaceae sp. FL0594]